MTWFRRNNWGLNLQTAMYKVRAATSDWRELQRDVYLTKEAREVLAVWQGERNFLHLKKPLRDVQRFYPTEDQPKMR